MKTLLSLSVFLFILIISCNQDDLMSDHNLTRGKFQLDSLKYQIKPELTNNDSLWHYIEAKLTYHFENYRGNLNTVIFTINDSIGLGLNIDYVFPDSVNKILSLKQNISLRKKLNNGDSVKVECSMSGAFFEVNNNSFSFVDTFSLYKKDITYYHE